MISIFENAQKNVINRQKWPKWQFWWSITFFVHFQKNNQKNICAFNVFKAESKAKHEEIFLCEFSLKTKNALF